MRFLLILLAASFAPCQPIAYLTAFGDAKLTIVDLGAQKQIGTIPLGASSFGIKPRVSPDGRRIYVPAGLRIAAVDTTTLGISYIDPNLTSSQPLSPYEIALSPDGGKIVMEYSGVALSAPGALVSIDAATGKVLWASNVRPGSLTFSPDGQRLYVLPRGIEEAFMQVIDVSDGRIVNRVFIRSLVLDSAAFSPDGKRIYISGCMDLGVPDEEDPGGDAQYFTGGIAVMDAANFARIANIPLVTNSCASNLTISPDGTRGYVSNFGDVDVVDLVETRRLKPILTGRFARFAVAADGRTAWILDSDVIRGIDLETYALANTIPLDGPESSIMLAPTAPVLTAAPLLDAASFEPRVAPGSIASLFGRGLARSTAAAAGVPLPKSLLDTVVTLNGSAAPLFLASDGQINLQVPWEMAPGPVSLRVERSGLASETRTVTIEDIAPAIFAVDQSGRGAIIHAVSSQLVTADAPASAGEVLSIFATGLGPVKQPVNSGEAPPTSDECVSAVQVTIGGVAAEVLFAGLSTQYPGLYQVNVRVGAGTPAGASVPVALTVLGMHANVVNTSIQ